MKHRVIALLFALAGTLRGAEPAPAPPPSALPEVHIGQKLALSRLEDRLSQPGAEPRWSKTIGKLVGAYRTQLPFGGGTAQATAVVTALAANAPDGVLRGLRIELSDPSGKRATVYIDEDTFADVKQGLADVASMETRMSPRSSGIGYGGAAIFWSRKDGLLPFTASTYAMADNEWGLAVGRAYPGPGGSAGLFHFPGREVAELTALIDRGIQALKEEESPPAPPAPKPAAAR